MNDQAIKNSTGSIAELWKSRKFLDCPETKNDVYKKHFIDITADIADTYLDDINSTDPKFFKQHFKN